MATVTAGTKTTTSLTALQWQFGGLAPADIATLNAAIRSAVTGAYGAAAASVPYIEEGILHYPDGRGNIQLQASDWIMVDGAGWPVVVPGAIFSTSWQHS